MKKFLLSLVAFTAMNIAAIAQTTDVTTITGIYTSDLYIQIDDPLDDKSEPEDDSIAVTIVEGEQPGTVNFQLKDFCFKSLDLMVGDINLPNIPLACDGNGNYTFGENPAVDMWLAEGQIFAKVNIEPSTSSIKNGVLSADVNINWYMDPEDPTVEPTPIYVRVVSKEFKPTGISTATATVKKATSIYTIDGKRVNEAGSLGKGVYIVDGKKVIK